jgi:hypothetical protein
MVVSTEMNVVVLRSYDGDARGEVAPEKPYPERVLGYVKSGERCTLNKVIAGCVNFADREKIMRGDNKHGAHNS